MRSDRRSTTLRLRNQERREFEEKLRGYGFDELSPFVRFAVRRLAQGN